MNSVRTESLKNREALYSWFAALYLHEPNERLLQPFLNIETTNVLASVFQDEKQQKTLRELAAYVELASVGDLKSEFNALFVVPTKGSYTPPYESCFRENKGKGMGNLWGETTADVAKSYRAAGYEATNLQGVFAPDHIGVELAFIAKLCHDILQSFENKDFEQARKREELRKSFLREHISQWIEDFSRAVGTSSSSVFYRRLSALTVDLIHSDLSS
ncbi:MAG TPA: molecular chaperone TorD family protein [Candidatus Bathyarchaeia archaeon]|nr:molecular chaperone TorD family protein [Candidatus Bathyarchaeia archaeon]